MNSRRTMKISDAEVVMLLDCINAQMTDAKWRKDPKRGEAMWELYQTIGQTLGETDITLSYTVVNGLIPTDLKPSKGSSNGPVTGEQGE